jgi:hypothetical protein
MGKTQYLTPQLLAHLQDVLLPQEAVMVATMFMGILLEGLVVQVVAVALILAMVQAVLELVVKETLVVVD